MALKTKSTVAPKPTPTGGPIKTYAPKPSSPVPSTVKATTPDGRSVNVSVVNGRTQTTGLPAGTVVHTAGGNFQITGGSGGAYTSNRVGSSDGSTGTNIFNLAKNIVSGGSSSGSSGSAGGSSGFSTPYGGYKTPQEYADAIKRVEASGGNFQNKAAAAVFKAAYPQLFTSQPIQLQQQYGTGDLSSILSKFSNGYTYIPPSESELSSQARQYAELQTNPLLSAIRSRLDNAQTQYANQKATIDAAYSTLPQRTNQYLKMAEEQALQRAIRMGGGRGGEVNWFTQKMQEPVIMEAQQKEAERAARLSAIANALAEAQAGGERERQEAISRQGQLEAYRLAELRDAIRQAQLQQSSIDRETLLNLLPQFMNG